MRIPLLIGLLSIFSISAAGCGGEPGYIGDPSVVPGPDGIPLPPTTDPTEQDIRDFVTPTTDRFTLFIREDSGPLDTLWAYNSEASATLKFSIIGDTTTPEWDPEYPDGNPDAVPVPPSFHPEKFRMALGTITLSATDITRGIDLSLSFSGEMARQDSGAGGLEGVYSNLRQSTYMPEENEVWAAETAAKKISTYDYRGFEFSQGQSAYANLFGGTLSAPNLIDCSHEYVKAHTSPSGEYVPGYYQQCGTLYEVNLLEATPARVRGTYRVMLVAATEHYDETTGDYTYTPSTVTEINGDFDIVPDAFGISGELGE